MTDEKWEKEHVWIMKQLDGSDRDLDRALLLKTI